MGSKLPPKMATFALLFIKKFLNNSHQILFCLVKVVVDNDPVGKLGKCHLILGLADTLLNLFGRGVTTTDKTFAQHFDRRCLHKDEKRTLAIVALETATTLDINVEKDILLFELLLHLGFQRAIKSSGIDLLIFNELVGSNARTEFVGCEEILVDTMLLLATWRTACRRYRKAERGVLLHQKMHQC